MSGTQQLRMLMQQRLTAAVEEIFVLVEKTISEYQDEVVQSKREVVLLKQEIQQLSTLQPHAQIWRTDFHYPPVYEDMLPLQQLNPRQQLMPSHDQDKAIQQSPQQVKEEPLTDSQPVSEELLPLQQLNPWQEMMSSQDDTVVQQPSQVKEEQVDFSIIPDSVNTISNSVTNGFVNSATNSDNEVFPPHTSVTVGTNRDVANKRNESVGQSLVTFDSDAFCMEQKVCRFCRKQFHRDSDLKKHVEESHPSKKPFKCPKCVKEFARRDQWSVHYRIHTGVKPHSCAVCGKVFTHSHSLTAHMKIHTGVKPHSCPVCGKLFSERSNRNVHMRLHTGVKPHACLVCGKSFSNTSNLKVHMRGHAR